MDEISVIALVHQVDGGLWDIELPRGSVAKLDRLIREGYKGKQLVHELIGDDLSVPPRLVVLQFAKSSGRPGLTVPYV